MPSDVELTVMYGQILVMMVGGVEIGTLFAEHPVAIPPGSYGLVFQARPGDPLADRLDPTFGAPLDPAVAIRRSGAGLAADHVLRERAAPA